MNVLLIQPHSGFQLRGITYPVCRDLMMTATFLKQRGFSVQIWDRCISRKDILSDHSADAAILFYAQSSSAKDAAAVSDRLRSKKIPVIWADMGAVIGAPLPDIFRHCDYILMREYCFAAEALLQAIRNGEDVRNVRGIAYAENGQTVYTEPQPLPDFSLLSPVDWTLIDVDKCFRRFQSCSRMLYLNASVGCPFSCGFCSTPLCYGQRRKRPISHVTEEIDYLVKYHGLNGINFSDELLLFTDDELEALRACREKNNGAFIWGGETRPQLLDPSMLQKMYDAGCRWLLFGLESGSRQMRARLDKAYDPNKIRSIVDACTGIGIATFGSFIVGYPDETQQDLRDTVQFALSLDLDALLFNYYVFIGGTPLYLEAENKGVIRIESILEYEKTVNTDRLCNNLSQIPDVELKTVKSYFDYLTITQKKKAENGGTAGLQFLKKAARSAADYLHGSPGAIVGGLWSIFKRGCSVFWYPAVHPRIRRKYGLYK